MKEATFKQTNCEFIFLNYICQLIFHYIEQLYGYKHTFFISGFSANESGANINIKAFLTTPDQTKLNALFMCYKTLFHIKPVALKIGTKTVNVYRCYNDSYILPTIKGKKKKNG